MIREDAFDREFPDETACKNYLMLKRWPDGVKCVRCNRKEKVYALKARPFHWVCKNDDCGKRNGYRFSILTRTIFQDTKIPLKLWFKVGYLMLSAKKGLSSLQVRRVIFGEESGTDWRTCWYMCHRWRAAMRGDVLKLDGIVEIDETYVGGKDKNRHQNKKSKVARDAAGRELKPAKMYRPGEAIGYKKITVIGAIARKGNVVARVLGDMDARTKTDFVKSAVSEKVSLVATDEDPAFKYIDKDMPHEAVNHSANEYVRGIVHTGTIDGFWSLLKRGIMGSYHHVSKDYLPLYLNEFSFRYNNRKNPDVFGDLLTTCG